ncbi:MAG: hypothetical protein D6699_02750, partial [Aquificota bacterium]
MFFTEEGVKERLYKNYEFLSRKAPSLLEVMSKAQTIGIVVKEGKIDADLGGSLLYGGDAYGASLLQVENYVQKPMRIFPDVVRNKEGIDVKVIAHRFGLELQERVGERIEPLPLSRTGYMPLLLMVGLGFGFHLEALLQRYEIQNLVIMDVPEFFRLSIYTLDWERFFDYFSKPGRRVSFLISEDLILEQDMDKAFSELLRIAQQLNPGVFYWGYFYKHLDYNPPIRVAEWFDKSPLFAELFQG